MVPTIVICSLLVLFGLLALKQDFRNRINIYFFFFTAFLAAWIVVNFASNTSHEYSIVLWTNRLIFLFSTLLLFFLLQFSVSYPHQSKTFSNKLQIIVSLLTTLTSILSVTPFVAETVEIVHQHSEINFGFGIYIYVVYFFFIFFLFIREVYTKYKTSLGKEKEKIQYLVLGIIITGVGAGLTNLLLPILFDYYELSNYGPAFSIIFVSSTAYAIIKYQLFDIRLILGKFFYYLIASIPAYFTYFLLALFYESLFSTSINRYAFLIGVPVAIVFSMFVNFSNKFISEYTDSHLINPGYNPLVVLEQLRQRLASALDIDRIGHESLFIIARTIRPNFIGIILKTDNHDNQWISINYKNQPFTNPEVFNTFIQLLTNHKLNSLVYDELITTDGYDIDLLLKNRVRDQMEKLKLSVVIPIRQDFKVTGLLLLGQKEANSPYGRQEVRFLISIAESTSLAVGRALLYQEIQLFNATLQKKVNDATQALLTKNQDLEDALGKLEEIRRQEKDMLDVMGHELRTPISIARNAVVTMQKEIMKEDTDEAKLEKYTHMAVESIRREISLIETFLSTTKLEGSRMQINPEPINLSEVAQESLEAHKDLAERNNTKVIINQPEKEIIVSADKIRIQEIADNFLNNAIKYTGEGNVVVTIYEKDGLGWMDVKDDGIGISPENLQKLGKKFFRAQTLYNKSGNIVNPSGTGLGLFVSFQLIDLMQGKRSITSKEGEGSTFSFGLPLQH